MRRLFAALAAILCISTLCGTAVSADRTVLSDVTFFGDSTTAHLAVRGGIPKERVWSGEGSTMLFTSVLERSVKIKNELMTLPEAVKRYRPKVLVITVGASGGAGFLREDTFKSIYSKLIDGVKEASEDTVVIVQSILPLSDKSKKYYKKLTKQAVLTANEWIKDVCKEKHVPYLNSHDLLTDDSGYLKREYQNDEYLHLTSAAYKIILDNLSDFLEKSEQINV